MKTAFRYALAAGAILSPLALALAQEQTRQGGHEDAKHVAKHWSEDEFTSDQREQEELSLDPRRVRPISPVKAVKNMQATARAKAQAAVISSSAISEVVGPVLKTFAYTVASPRDGLTHSGSIVGADPRNNGARAINVPVVLIPLKVVFTGGTPRTFDPGSPDTGCLGGNVITALANTQASPIFTPVANTTINAVNMGNVTFIDAFQRAQFWSDTLGGPMVSVKPAYHLGLPVTVAPTQTISMANNPAGSGATFSFTGDCGLNAISVANPPRIAFVDINFVDVQLLNIISSLGLNPSQFPLFLFYRTYMTDGPPGTLSNNCCILGYHNSTSGAPANPGQTYGIAAYDSGFLFGAGTKDVSVLSHEILEWVNDPSTNNVVPNWGNIGQVSSCQDNLETGDPLSGKLQPGILMPNGVTYHPQENAFFSWFLGTGFTGAGGKYSSNGTFSGYAKNCPPGGTN